MTAQINYLDPCLEDVFLTNANDALIINFEQYAMDPSNPLVNSLVNPMTATPEYCPVTYYCLGDLSGKITEGCDVPGEYSFDQTTGTFTLFAPFEMYGPDKKYKKDEIFLLTIEGRTQAD